MTDPGADAFGGPGRLVLVVGPSGAGKDTLIRAARDRFASDPRFHFPRRMVTRPASAAEDNHSCDPATFHRMAEAGGFAASWTAHGQSYGIPASIGLALADGRTVVCNVSRTVVDVLRARYPDVLVIEVTAPPSVLAERLAARSRPEDGDLSRRVRRSGEVRDVRPDLTVTNVGPLDEAAAAFCEALASRTTTASADRPSADRQASDTASI
ncbi:phosphonate metabolism protein/1,5-bisphosphokinase (PRPP-forming) PhnN [uncultured Enterovirga sp.]|uniref:phosphonate metabolism protein/1,5-bisphosphokinase (PRPP-forming) PhnN n=1 Tax=uncultured Enterovirga sp. TaxID=2026352 RepID=UPI0035CA37AB